MMTGPTTEGRRVASLESQARTAIRRASELAWSGQRSDGSWVFPADTGPSSTAQAMIALAACDALDPEVAGALGRCLAALQLPDGSFVRFPLARGGDAPTTAVTAAALELAGGAEAREASARAWAFVERHGGVGAIADRLAEGELAIAFLIAAKRAPRALAAKSGVEIFAVPGLSNAIARRVHGGVLTVVAQLAFLAHDRQRLSAARRYAFDRAFELAAQFQNEDGSFNGFTLPTALAACAFTAFGSPEGARRARLAARWLARRVRPTAVGTAWVPGFELPTWSTAAHLRALFYAGTPAEDPRAGKAVAWLLATQQRRLQASLNQPDPRAPRSGGWAFDPENHTLPDCDDTGVVLSVLGMARAALPSGHCTRAAIESAATKAIDWLAAMQNADGGWAAYVKGLPGKAPGPMQWGSLGISSRARDLARFAVSPPLALGDPSTEDVTARVLHGLAAFGATRERDDVRRAVCFLKRQQCEDGSFWGRWMMNHLAGSSYALQAAQAIGETLDVPWVARTASWILSRQNADGSWGETPASYRDPSLAGRGAGMAPLTGLVSIGLCAIGLRRHPAVARAVTWLLERQRPGGDWPDDGYVVPLLLPDTFYAHPETGLYYPLEAIARFERAHP